MKEHVWRRELIDGGLLGQDWFWKCDGCGGSAGPLFYDKQGALVLPNDDWAFYADGSGMKLMPDCDESKALIETHNKLGHKPPS